MINLKTAYKTSAKIGRSPNGVDIKRRLTRKIDEEIKSIGTFKSSQGDILRCRVCFPYVKGRKKVTIFKSTKEVLMKPLSIDERFQGTIDCECKDFLFTFYSAVAKKGGNSKTRVVPKAKGTSTTVRHIDKPGMCKHVMALFDILVKEKYIKL